MLKLYLLTFLSSYMDNLNSKKSFNKIITNTEKENKNITKDKPQKKLSPFKNFIQKIIDVITNTAKKLDFVPTIISFALQMKNLIFFLPQLLKTIMEMRYFISYNPTKALTAYMSLSNMFKSTVEQIQNIIQLFAKIQIVKKIYNILLPILKKNNQEDRFLFGIFKKSTKTLFAITKKILISSFLANATKIAIIATAFTPPLSIIGTISASIMTMSFILSKLYSGITITRDQTRMQKYRNLLTLFLIKKQLDKLNIKTNLNISQKYNRKPYQKNNNRAWWIKKIAQTGYGTFVGVVGSSTELLEKITNVITFTGICTGIFSICSGGVGQVLLLHNRSQDKKSLKQYTLNIKKELNIEQLTNKEITEYVQQYSKVIDSIISTSNEKTSPNLIQELSLLKKQISRKPVNHWSNLVKHNITGLIDKETSFKDKIKNIEKEFSQEHMKMIESIKSDFKNQNINNKESIINKANIHDISEDSNKTQRLTKYSKRHQFSKSKIL